MPLNFPTGPSINQLYIFNGIRWKWNGYAWISSGICGANGSGFTGDYVSGITGGIGVTVSGPNGFVEVSLRLDEPNIGEPYFSTTHTAPTIFSGDTGAARKVAFLQENGSVAFDYIKNYDVFRKAEFEFDILSYDIPGLNPKLIGNTITRSLQLSPFEAVMTYNQSPTVGEINVTNASIHQQTGFPAPIETFLLETYQFLFTQTLAYKELTYTNVGVNGDYYNIQIGVTGSNADDALVYKTKDYNLYFYNYIFHGQSQLTTLTTADFPSLTPVLNESRTFAINTTVTQNNATPYYLYYAFPARLGIATFRDNATNIEGGFVQQTTGNGVYSYTNSNGYTENYVIYRSEQGNLGTVSISVI